MRSGVKQKFPVIIPSKAQNLYADDTSTAFAARFPAMDGRQGRPMNGKGVQRTMANSNNLVNPNAREAMDRFKMEAASEVGVNLKQGYNGDLTSKQAGSVGGQMVKKMIEAYENGMK